MPPRRRHFNVVRRCNATPRTRNTVYNEEGKLGEPESGRIVAYGGDAVSKPFRFRGVAGSQPSPDEADGALIASTPDTIRYSHKKFKKMESVKLVVLEEEVGGAFCSPPASVTSVTSVTSPDEKKRASVQHKRRSTEETRDSSSSSSPPEGGGGAEEGEGEGEEDGLAEEAKRSRLAGGRHVCTFCGLVCAKPSVLQKHVRAHTNERPYPCAPCGFAFKTKSNLYKHCKSRAHHLKLANGGDGDHPLPPLDEPEADAIETDDSTASERDAEEEATCRSGGREQPASALLTSSPPLSIPPSSSSFEAPPPTPSTPIYKPKFHSVSSSSSSGASISTTSSSVVVVVTPRPADDKDDGLATLGSLSGSGVEKIPKKRTHAVPLSNHPLPVVSEESAGVCLAKRRNEQFRLHLDIPQPLAAVASDANASATPTVVSVSVSLSAHPPLTPPVGASPSVPAARSQRSPKLASPEYLQQHISNLISQNAAIVETLDPLWPRRYTKQLSVASGSNVDAELRSRERHRRFSEDVVSPSSSSLSLSSLAPPRSKLALALLADNSPASPKCSVFVPSPASTYRQGSSVSLHPRDGPADSAVKSLLIGSGGGCRVSSDAHHPQNPEGSIIKDLLLKTRNSKSTSAPVLTSCMRLSGGSISSDGSAAMTDLTVSTSVTRAVESTSAAAVPQQQRERERLPASPSSLSRESDEPSLFADGVKSADTTDTHREHYSPRSRLLSVTPRISSGAVPQDEGERREKQRSSRVVAVVAGGGSRGDAQSPAHKPRGRPKGSKNRPKVDGLPSPGCGQVLTKFPVRVHSKSVSEAVGSAPVEHHAELRLDALKGRLGFRRNSVSGDPNGVSDTVEDLLTYRRQGDVERASGSTPEVTKAATPTWNPMSNGGGLVDGAILKKHLLSGERSPPPKKRRLPEEMFKSFVEHSVVAAPCKKDASLAPSLRSLEQLSKYPRKTSAVHMFGGQVEICDGAETKKIIIDSSIQSPRDPSSMVGAAGDMSSLDPSASSVSSSTSSVVATIAKPVHNSGGTVLQFNRDSKSPVASTGRPLLTTGGVSTRTSLSDMSGSIVLTNSVASVGRAFSIDISHLHLLASSAASSATTTTVTSSAGASPVTSSLEGNILNISSLFASADPGSTSVKGGNARNVDCSDARAIKKDDFFEILKNSGSLTKSDDLRPNASLSKTSEGVVVGRKEVPLITVQPPKSPAAPVDKREPESSFASVIRSTSDASSRSLLAPPRPTSLALKSVTHTSMVGTTLVSPETPRPKKKYGQCYINGQYYTYLELKQSTRAYYCCIYRPQPMYVPQSTDSKLSMYSVWQIVPPASDPLGLPPDKAMSLYASKPRYSPYTVAQPAKLPYVVTHSSYWTFQQQNCEGEPTDAKSESQLSSSFVKLTPAETEEPDRVNVDGVSEMGEEANDSDSTVDEEIDVERTTPFDYKLKTDLTLKPKSREGCVDTASRHPRRVRIFEGGFKSNEDYTYVRGRGRGKYLCEECGIRCKKPSMLKKHIRTHTDVRPYTCKHCNFSFKTKGNLTKHMKSKAHHKKCVELGIVPVPVTIDDAQIDEEALARQERIEHQRKQFADVDEDSALEDDDDDEDEEDDDDYDYSVHEEYKEGEEQDDEDDDDSVELEGQFEDANEVEPPSCSLVEEDWTVKVHSERDVAHGLLELCKPEAIQVAVSSLHLPLKSSSREYHHHDSNRSLESQEQGQATESRHSMGDRDDLIGNPRVVWTSQNQRRETDIVAKYGGSSEMDYSTATNRVTPPPSVSSTFHSQVQHADDDDDDYHRRHSLYEARGYSPEHQPRLSDKVLDNQLLDRHRDTLTLTSGEVDQPMDLSMPHNVQHYHHHQQQQQQQHHLQQQQQQDLHNHRTNGHDKNDNDRDECRRTEDDEEEDADVEEEEGSEEVGRCHRRLLGERYPPEAYYSYPHSMGGRDIRASPHDPVGRSAVESVVPSRRYENASSAVVQSAVELFHRSTGLAVSSMTADDPYSLDECRRKTRGCRDEEAAAGKMSVLHSYLSVTAPAAVAAARRLASEREAKRHRPDSSSSSRGVGERNPSPQPSGGTGSSDLSSPRTPILAGYGQQPPPPPLSPLQHQQHPYSPSESKARPTTAVPEYPPRTSLAGLQLMPMFIHRSMEDGKSVCSICNKAFSKPSQLRLHINIHYFERPFRCDSCAISFRTKGHLQKHKRSVSHYNKVNMNMTFGTPTTDNPRPFKCDDCKIAFRIHGHLAKHLRSKMHIMKLECLGKLPFGTYAEIERSGANLNEIDTTDCENSLESLQLMAIKLVEKVPPHQRWTRERTVSGGSCDDQSDGVPYIESPVGAGGSGVVVSGGQPRFGVRSPGDDDGTGAGCASPDFTDASRLVLWSQQRAFESSNLSPSSPESTGTPGLGVKRERSDGGLGPSVPDVSPHALDDSRVSGLQHQQPRSVNGHQASSMGQRASSVGSLVQDYEDISDDEDDGEVSEGEATPNRHPLAPHPSLPAVATMKGVTCGVCGKVLKSAKFLQMHIFMDHPDRGDESESGDFGRIQSIRKGPAMIADSSSWRIPVHHSTPGNILTSAPLLDDRQYSCELCGEICNTHNSLKQHMIAHAQLRPFVCDICDAGFTNSHYLKLHLQSHQQEKGFSCADCSEVCSSLIELEHHVDLAHPILESEQVR